MNKYGPKAQKEVEKAMHDHKHKSKYQLLQQAIAVGLLKLSVPAAKSLVKNNLYFRPRFAR